MNNKDDKETFLDIAKSIEHELMWGKNKNIISHKEYIKPLIMNTVNNNENHKCDKAGINDSKIITETTFGHGDSMHNCYVECKICGKKSKVFSDYGLFERSTLRQAEKDWNDNLDIDYE